MVEFSQFSLSNVSLLGSKYPIPSIEEPLATFLDKLKPKFDVKTLNKPDLFLLQIRRPPSHKITLTHKGICGQIHLTIVKCKNIWKFFHRIIVICYQLHISKISLVQSQSCFYYDTQQPDCIKLASSLVFLMLNG